MDDDKRWQMAATLAAAILGKMALPDPNALNNQVAVATVLREMRAIVDKVLDDEL